MKLVKCKICRGAGTIVCCNGHMCPGFKQCFDCNGKGKQLSEKDKKILAQAEKLKGYR